MRRHKVLIAVPILFLLFNACSSTQNSLISFQPVTRSPTFDPVPLFEALEFQVPQTWSASRVRAIADSQLIDAKTAFGTNYYDAKGGFRLIIGINFFGSEFGATGSRSWTMPPSVWSNNYPVGLRIPDFHADDVLLECTTDESLPTIRFCGIRLRHHEIVVVMNAWMSDEFGVEEFLELAVFIDEQMNTYIENSIVERR